MIGRRKRQGKRFGVGGGGKVVDHHTVDRICTTDKDSVVDGVEEEWRKKGGE